MFILFEMDRRWTLGVDFKWPRLWGVRLGWVALHIVIIPWHEWAKDITESKKKD
jgi:hypothetical protein